MSNSRPFAITPELTEREIEILQMVTGGCTNRDISERLNITRDSVSTYIYRIKKELGLSSRKEMIALSAKEVKRFRKEIKQPQKKKVRSLLSTRETEIIILVAHGLTNDQIARKLQPRITKGVVEKRLRQIFEKLSLFSRVELAIYALKASLVTLEDIDLDEIRRARKESLMQ